ncbi:hypothetical protein [Rhodanobacter sp. UC4451_H18]
MSHTIASALKEALSEMGLLVEPIPHKYEVANFEWAPESIDESEIVKILELFSRWAKERLAQTNRRFSEKQLEDAFLARLARPEFSSVFVDEDPEKKRRRLKGLLGLGAIDATVKDELFLDYLVAEFVLTANDAAPDVFEEIAKISYGSLIAEAVSGLATPTVRPAEHNLRVVLDSPLVMDLLDLNTPEHKSYAEGLVDLFISEGVRLAVFDHSVDEIRRSIKSTLGAYARGDAFGPLAQRFKTVAGHKLYAITVMDSLESRIKDLGIAILPSRIYEEARFKKFFPEERVDQVRNAIGDLHEHLDARIRDSMSVAVVARLKGEQRLAASLFEAGTVFVTRNSVLVKRVNRALSVGRGAPDPRFTIVTDGQIAGFFWFVSGFKLSENLSRRRLIANCSSAVLPRKDVISKIANVLEGLSPELKNEFEALMTDKRASLCPMRLTAAGAEHIDGDMSLRVLAAMKEELVVPVIQQVEEAKTRVQERDVEVQRAHAERREMVLAMQEIVQGAEEQLALSQVSFNDQLAQLQFNLETQARVTEGLAKTARDNLENISQKISIEANKLQTNEAGARRILKYGGAVFVGVPSLIAILFPDYQSWPLKIVLAVAFICGMGITAPFVSRVIDRLVEKMFPSQRSYLMGLEQARLVAESQAGSAENQES